ncbi:hypothetical protein Tco_0955213 [Tanacetum coccineum]|uniref:Uncharacterized protein n=1 Tax=Tanacetum coccineum TaxID=301880 RepID=A0ABQ5E6L2_9ASTR
MVVLGSYRLFRIGEGIRIRHLVIDLWSWRLELLSQFWLAYLLERQGTLLKLNFGKCERPIDDDVLRQEQQDRCNFVRLSWILGCATQELYLGRIYSTNSKTVWDEFKETYSKTDASFLMGLDDVFGNVRSSILITEPLLDVKCVELVGYPLRFKKNHKGNNSKATVNNVTACGFSSSSCNTHILTSDECQKLMGLLRSSGSSNTCDIGNVTGEWLKFNHNFSSDIQKEFRKRFLEIRIKGNEYPEGLDFEEFGALHKGIALQNLNQFCHVSYEQDDRRFTSQAWNRLFRIKEQVVREYVMEFLSSFTFRDYIEELDTTYTMVFQLGGERRSMTMRQFIQALGLYTHQEMNTNLFEAFYDSCYRSRPINYDPNPYVICITTHASYDTRHPSTYTSIQNPICHLVHHSLTLFVAGSYSGKEKVTMDDLFLLHSMDGGVSVDVPWHVAKFLYDKAKGYNGLGIGEMVAEILEVAGDDDDRAGQAEIGGVRRHHNMSNANRLRPMDERLGEIVNDVTELTYVLLARHHMNHTHYKGTRYSFVLDIPNLGVQQGVNFLSGTPGYSTAPSPSASQFGMFGDAHPSTSHNHDDMNQE